MYIRALEFIHLKTEILYPLTSINTFHPSLQLLETIILCFHEFGIVVVFKRFYI